MTAHYNKIVIRTQRDGPLQKNLQLPTPVAAPSKLWVCGRSLAAIVDLNLGGGMDVSFLWTLCVVT